MYSLQLGLANALGLPVHKVYEQFEVVCGYFPAQAGQDCANVMLAHDAETLLLQRQVTGRLLLLPTKLDCISR